MRRNNWRILSLLLCLCLALAGCAAAGAEGNAPAAQPQQGAADQSAAALDATVPTSFPDVAPDAWYWNAVTQMTGLGLLRGCEDGAFQPERAISAAEFVTITARCAQLSPGRGQTEHWAAGTMQAALEAGWYDWDEIPPTGEKFDLPIPRQLAVKVLMRALLPNVRGDYNTESAKITDFPALDGRYYEPVLAAYAAGVVIGDETGRFRPADGMSRAEACMLFQRALAHGAASGPAADAPDIPSGPPEPVAAVRGGVTENGWLQVIGSQMCNEAGDPVVLRGMSTHGLQWYGQYACAQSIQNTAAYGANVFRLAMYTGEGGYLSQPEAMKRRLIAAADEAIRQDMYVILDWHILSDGNPMAHAEEAEAFFAEMAALQGQSGGAL